MAQKPHWPADLALTPQVFQFQDRYHEDLIAERFAAMFDYAWGIRELKWDLGALHAGQVVLEYLRAIMPDGTPLTYDAQKARGCAPCSVHHLPESGSVIVHLGIERLSSQELGNDSVPSRFAKERVLVADDANDGKPVQLEWLRPRLSLHLEGERLDSYTTLPCARVLRLGPGVMGFDPTFIPPILTIGASRFLDVELRRALDGLQACRLALGRLPLRDGAEDVRPWLVSLIGSFVPRIADAIERRAHPHQTYLLVAETLGALSAFTAQGDARIPPFEFYYLGPIFSVLFASLRSVLDALGAENYRRIPLSAADPTTLYAELKDPGIFRMAFYLGVAGDDVERIRREVPRIFKVASWRELAQVVRTRSKGVTLLAEGAVPSALPSIGGVVYFLLQKDEAFAPIFKTGELAVHHPEFPGIREVSLFAVETV